MPKISLLVLLLLCSCALYAQTWEIGGMAGAAGYMGDLNQTNPVKVSGAAVGGFVKRNFNGYLSAKISFIHGNIQGADSTSRNEQFYDRNLSFQTKLNEISLIGEFNFLKYIPDVSESRFTPYVYLGIGAVNYTPLARYQGHLYNLRGLTTEGQSKPYPNFALTIPYGAGVKYNFAGKWTLGADAGYRNPNTDYLDDVSGLYPGKTQLPNAISQALSDRSGERLGTNIGSAGSQRGDLRNRDTYFFFGITLSYTFVTEKCYFER